MGKRQDPHLSMLHTHRYEEQLNELEVGGICRHQQTPIT